MKREVTTSYLEMRDQAVLRPGREPSIAISFIRAEFPTPELNRFFYTSVGWRWWWYVRLSWNRARWLIYLDRPELETWVAYVGGTPAGYFELEKQNGGDVEIAYIGLLPAFLGKGLGASLLSAATSRAWAMGASRVWVHTCDLDHPRALANYLARGFRVIRSETNIEELPDGPLEPWPGAGDAFDSPRTKDY